MARRTTDSLTPDGGANFRATEVENDHAQMHEERSRYPRCSTSGADLSWHVCERTRQVARALRSGLRGQQVEPVAEAADGDEVGRRVGVELELLSQADDEVVDGAFGALVVQTPRTFEQLIA